MKVKVLSLLKTKKLQIAMTICILIATLAAVNIASIHASYAAAANEYNELRSIKIASIEEFMNVNIENGEVEGFFDIPENEPVQFDENGLRFEHLRLSQEMLSLNPDYIGWINIPNTRINYPVVQGVTNDTYLRTTFMGERNSAGSIFMDVRNEQVWEANFKVLYGHNMRDGSMFSDLVSRRNDLETIEIIMSNAEVVEFKVIETKTIDIWHPIFSLLTSSESEVTEFVDNLIGPEYSNLLVLSTCVGVEYNPNLRFIVLAVN